MPLRGTAGPAGRGAGGQPRRGGRLTGMSRAVWARPAPRPGLALPSSTPIKKPHRLQPGRKRSVAVDVRRLQEEKEKVHPRPPGRGATRRRREQGRRSRGRVERRSARAHSPIGFAWSWCWYARQIYRESTRKGTILAIIQAGRFRSRAAFFQLQKTKTKRAPPKAAAAGLKQKGGDSSS